MNIKDGEILVKNLEAKKSKLSEDNLCEYDKINKEIENVKKDVFENLSAWDRVCLARHQSRPKAIDYINLLFDNFYELHGDRCYMDDSALIGGIGTFEGMAVTVLAQSKGRNVEENLKRNFGMVSPDGYRKALRLAYQAQKFNRPIITIVDTPGAYPGKEAEQRGQAEAIAKCLYEFSNISVPIICIVISEGGSGGALALSIADRIVMLENSIYSILSPEGFASILWKDELKAKQASEVMKLTSYDLFEKGIVDEIIKEPLLGAQENVELVAHRIKDSIKKNLEDLIFLKKKILLKQRYDKYRKVGKI